jgi:RHS repeat-associated protein
MPLVRYAYDGVAYEGCNTVLSTVDAIGRRTAMCDGAGNESWAYDVMGRVLTDRRTISGSPNVTKDFTYTYNLDSSIATIGYPTGRTITYQPSAAGRTLWAKDITTGIDYAIGASYAPHGALRSLHQGASIISTFFYNTRLQPCRISVKSSGIAPTTCADTQTGNVLDFTYSFDLDPGAGVVNNGNVASIANNRDTNRSQSFTYDALNRIATAQTQATPPNGLQHCWGETFSYDIWGNLKSIAPMSPTYDGCTQENFSVTYVTEKNQLPASDGYQYDAAGNLTSASGMGSYTYDAENRMTATAGVTYSYDGDGRRVQKSNGKLYWYGMSGLDALLETDAAGNNPTEYVFFGGKRTARRDPGGSVFYYFADHLGTSRVQTTAAGAVCYDADYYPFGGERAVTNACPNGYKFTGKERDSESSMDYFLARYYSSASGRFMIPDWNSRPVNVPYADFRDPQTLNLYAYLTGNPLNSVDPDGHCGPLCAGVIGGAVGAAASLATQALDDEPFSFQELFATTAGGFVAGATFGALAGPATVTTLGGVTTLQTSTTITVTAGAAGGVAGGATQRVIASGDLGQPEDLLRDAVVGGAAGGLGQVAGQQAANTSAGQAAARAESRLTQLSPRASGAQLQRRIAAYQGTQTTLQRVEVGLSTASDVVVEALQIAYEYWFGGSN